MEIKSNHTSEHYRFTMDPESVYDQILLGQLKAQIKERNKFYHNDMRVEVRGRKAIIKQNNQSYDRGGNVIGGLANAREWDVYVYERRV